MGMATASVLREAILATEVRVRSTWTGEPPPPRKWLCQGWLPSGRVTLLTGPGATGKSLLTLQLAVTVATGAAPEGGSAQMCYRSWLALGKRARP